MLNILTKEMMASLITHSSRSSVEQMENFSGQKELKRQEIEDQFQALPAVSLMSKSDKINMNKSLNAQCRQNQEKEKFLQKLKVEYKCLQRLSRKPVSQIAEFERLLREALQKCEQAQEERKAAVQKIDTEKRSILIWKERIDKIMSVLKKISNAHKKALHSHHIAHNHLVTTHNHLVYTKSHIISNHKEFQKQIKYLKSLQEIQRKEINQRIEILCLFDQQIAINQENRQKNAESVEKLIESFEENKHKFTLTKENVKMSLDIINFYALKHRKLAVQDLDKVGAETIIENYKFFHFQEASLSRYFTELTDEVARKKKEIEELLQGFDVKRTLDLPIPVIKPKGNSKGFESDNLILLLFSTINNIIFHVNKSMESLKKWIPSSTQTYNDIAQHEQIVRSRTKFVFKDPFIKPSFSTRQMKDFIGKKTADAIKGFYIIRNFANKEMIQKINKTNTQVFVAKVITKAYENCYKQFDYRIGDLYTLITELSSDSEVEIKTDTIYLPLNKQASTLRRGGSLAERYKTNDHQKQNSRINDFPRLCLSSSKNLYRQNSLRDNSRTGAHKSVNIFSPKEVLREIIKYDRQLVRLRSNEKKAVSTLSSPEIKRTVYTSHLKQARYKARLSTEM